MEEERTAPSATPIDALAPGQVIAGRFTLEFLAGRGGMGHVYRARDNASGRPVALKLLHRATSAEVLYRFNREAALIAQLRHPGIVAYVSHGTTERGQPFLAMQWLEGEELSRRLARQPLSLPETLVLVRRVAEALTHAHQQGIVHRDLKPANLLLRSGRPEDVVLLDFGLARHAVPTLLGVTNSQTVVGTPGYMAPEQASSQPEISPAADIFSLGCVLYECLTGTPPFAAPHFAAVLAKILFAEPTPLHALRPDAPPGLQMLVERMLVKEPRRRLADADALLAALSTLESVPEPRLPDERTSPPLSAMQGEQKLVSVLLFTLEAPPLGAEAETEHSRGARLRDGVREVLAPFGAQVELLAEGSLVATLVPERGTATDQAALAARCALMLKERWPRARVVLVTGRGMLHERRPLGEAMDRAGLLLRRLDPISGASLVVMDEVTAGLLGPDFRLSSTDPGAYLLQGEQLGVDASRPLMGKPTPCVGRDQELALLDFTLSSCCEEPKARAVLVTAPAGAGKSRLRHEFLRRVERREQPVLVMLGRGSAMSAGATHSLLGQALRGLCGIVEDESLNDRRARLSQRLASQLPSASSQEVVEFLGELCAVPFPDDASPRLRAARGDPRLMSAQTTRAWVSFLKAECARQPVLLVLEDLHWSDALTVKLVEETLRELDEEPFLVMALARPEVKDLFPGLWSRHVQELPLGGLSRKASTRLAREVLGPQVPDAIVQQAVEQSAGNALLLEELIRRVADGRGEAVPETVLAVLQARVLRLEPGARQVLLAASLFGSTFWSGGIREVLQSRDDVLEQHLRRLVEQEVIAQQPTSRFATENEYHFRHALVRDAAYALMPDSQLVLGHQKVGAWLERVGETDALVLATHHQRGHQLGRAIHFHTQAAEQLFERHDLAGTTRCVEAALACGASDEARTRLRALQAMVFVWLDQMPRVLEVGGPILEELRAGSSLWCRLAGGLVTGYLFGGDQTQVSGLAKKLLSTQPDPEAIAAYTEACVLLGGVGGWSGVRPWMADPLERIFQVGREAIPKDPLVRGLAMMLKFQFLYVFEAFPWQAFMAAEQARQELDEIGMERNATMGQANVGMALEALGDLPKALELLRQAMANAQRMGQPFLASLIQHYLHMALAGSSEPMHWQEARVLLHQWMRGAEADPFRQGLAQLLLAQLDTGLREMEQAELHARRACELLAPFRTYMIHARTLLSGALLARGSISEARRVAELGVRDLEHMGHLGLYAVAMHLALAEACFGQDDTGPGQTALRKALHCVHDRARDIPDPVARERFLSRVPANARTLALARQHWGDSPS